MVATLIHVMRGLGLGQVGDGGLVDTDGAARDHGVRQHLWNSRQVFCRVHHNSEGSTDKTILASQVLEQIQLVERANSVHSTLSNLAGVNCAS